VKLVYTADAITDLKRLRQFIAQHNPTADNKIAAALIEKIGLLPEFPHIGMAVELAPVPDSVRDMIFGNYVVRYSVHATVIIILRVWHSLEAER
jgi:plasmid stabilization system protein ParE